MKRAGTTFLLPIMAVLLVVCIIAPSLIKLSHAIYEHHTFDCAEKSAVHFHQVEYDCDFQIFKNAPQYVLFSSASDTLPSVVVQERTDSQYFFLSQYQNLHFVLRGPPDFS